MELARKRDREVWHFCPGCSTWRRAEKFQTKKITQGTYGHCDECLTEKPIAVRKSSTPLFMAAGK
jgi:hypothetical protein